MHLNETQIRRIQETKETPEALLSIALGIYCEHFELPIDPKEAAAVGVRIGRLIGWAQRITPTEFVPHFDEFIGEEEKRHGTHACKRG